MTGSIAPLTLEFTRVRSLAEVLGLECLGGRREKATKITSFNSREYQGAT